MQPHLVFPIIEPTNQNAVQRIFILFSLIFLAGCQIQDVSELTSTPTPHIEISGQSDGAPAGCTPEHVAFRLQSLFDDISRGEVNVVPEYFGTSDGDHMSAGEDGQQFLWFCTNTPDGPFTVTDLDPLKGYFEQRYQQQERLRLTSIQVNGWEARRQIVHFGPISVERTANDLDPEDRQVGGKGAYSCEQQTFPVLCMGTGTVSE